MTAYLSSPISRHLVKNLAGALGKQVDIQVDGLENALPAYVSPEIFNQLMPLLLCNAVDQGIEAPDHRLAIGKDPYGTVRVRVSQSSDELILRVIDDGQGFTASRLAALVGRERHPGKSSDECPRQRGFYALLSRSGARIQVRSCHNRFCEIEIKWRPGGSMCTGRAIGRQRMLGKESYGKSLFPVDC